MKRWREAAPAERPALIEEALAAAGGKIGRAADLLDISRRHFNRVRQRIRGGTWDPGPTAGRVSRASVTVVPASDLIRFEVAFPRELLQWVERVALEWKHSGRTERSSRRAVLLIAVEQMRERSGG